jgi:putative phage-type endonuclease
MSTVETEDRSGFVGASEVAEALGLSPYTGASPVRLAQEKLGMIERKQIDPKLAEWGHRMQPLILKAVEDKIGMRVRETDTPRTHKTENFIRARTDGVTQNNIIVEAKNYAEGRAHKYPDEDSPEELPLYDLVQVATEMACWDAEVAYFAVLFGGRDFRCYRVERDPTFETEILTRLSEFWSYVRRGELPPARSAVDAALLYPRHDEGMVRTATHDISAKARELAALKEQVKKADERIERIENEIKATMGAAGILVAPTGEALATWKATADTTSFDSKKFKKDHPEMFDRYTVIKPGSRRFLLKV